MVTGFGLPPHIYTGVKHANSSRAQFTLYTMVIFKKVKFSLTREAYVMDGTA